VALHCYRYQVLRYIADRVRMEPINTGIVAQSDEGVSLRVNGRFRGDRRSGIPLDLDNFRQWREFLRGEIDAEGGAGFVPPHSSVDFLSYLRSRCDGPFQLSEPLHFESVVPTVEVARDYLYERLVARPNDDGADVPATPVERFRHEVAERSMERRFPVLHHNAYVTVGQSCYPFYYWYRNGRTVVIDKVEVGTQPRHTQLELESWVARLQSIWGAPRVESVSVVDPVDKLPPARTSDDEAFRQAYKDKIRQIERLSTKVISRADSVVPFVEELETELAQLLDRTSVGG